MTHAWCSDPARDEAVRAAEDNRQGPLPTLGEAIAAFCADDPAKRSPKVSETSGRQSGLRTERVTLELTGRFDSPPSEWPWEAIFSQDCRVHIEPGNNVRVVDEVAIDAAWVDRLTADRDAAIRERDDLRKECERRLTMCEEMKRDRDSQQFLVSCLRARVAELESAPAANVAANSTESPVSSEPVAWGVRTSNGLWMQAGLDVEGMIQLAIRCEASCVPLFASPPPARGWLTEEEREAVADAAETLALRGCGSERRSRILQSLLDRSSQPEVERPGEPNRFDYGDDAIANRDRQWRAALAAAGVKVKEVGK